MLSEKFMPIPPRYLRALQMLVEQKKRDQLGGIGVGALREEDEPITLEQLVNPLWERGLVEDLTDTELGPPGKYFVRITALGVLCLDFGLMLREPRKVTEAEINGLRLESPSESEEREAIAGEEILGIA